MNLFANPALWTDGSGNTPPSIYNPTWIAEDDLVVFNLSVSDTYAPQATGSRTAEDDTFKARINTNARLGFGELHFLIVDAATNQIVYNTPLYYADNPNVFPAPVTFELEAPENFRIAISTSNTAVVLPSESVNGELVGSVTLAYGTADTDPDNGGNPGGEDGGGDDGGDGGNPGNGDDDDGQDPGQIGESLILKGFVSYGTLVENDERVISTIGELSGFGRTFTRDQQIFTTSAGSNETPTAVDLTIFVSRRGDIAEKVVTPVEYGDALALIGKWLFNQSIDGILGVTQEEVRQALAAEFGTFATDFKVGALVTKDLMVLPSWIECKLNPQALGLTVDLTNAYLNTSRVKLWFSDPAFTLEFDEYQIANVAPFDNLDDFFQLSDVVKARIDALTMSQQMERIRVTIDETPSTLVKSIEFTYVDPNNTNNRFPTPWSFVIWGPAGENIDAIKSGLAEWILENSTHTRDEWAVIFPDIFKTTEVILMPQWQTYAIPNKTLEEGMYSPIVNWKVAREVALATCVGTNYTNAHILDNLSFAGTTYKSLVMLACGGPDNRDQLLRFERIWEDYLAVSTSSLDYDRMKPATQNFITLLHKLLKAAEKLTEFSEIPLGITRLRRKNSAGKFVTYAVLSLDNIQYLAVTKEWMLANFESNDANPNPLRIEPDVTTLVGQHNAKRLVTQVLATGGVGPYTYEVTCDTMVDGGIHPTNGQIDMWFANWGQQTILITVTDSLGARRTREYIADITGQGNQNP